MRVASSAWASLYNRMNSGLARNCTRSLRSILTAGRWLDAGAAILDNLYHFDMDSTPAGFPKANLACWTVILARPVDGQLTHHTFAKAVFSNLKKPVLATVIN